MSTEKLIAQVRAMQAQGMDNNQIIQALQRDGFKSSEIFDAMNQAALASGNPGTPFASRGDDMNQFPPPPHPNNPGSPMAPPHPPSAPPVGAGSDVEEVVEAIIDEKWNELVKDITTIIEWKNQAQNTIISMEQQFQDLKSEFDKLHQALIAKIGEYDKNILDVGAEVKAMEKVFSKVLPVFTENVSELSRITKDMKGKGQQ